MDKFIVFLDIDGTLDYHGKIPEENIKAIEKAQKNGHLVMLNTGRSYGNIHKRVLDSAKWDGVLCGLGSDIRFKGKQVFSKPIPWDLMEQYEDLFDTYPLIYECEDGIYENEKCYKECFVLGELIKSQCEIYSTRLSKFNVQIKANEELIKRLEKDFFVYEHPTYTEMCLKGLGKDYAIKKLMTEFTDGSYKSIGMGDSDNDITMLKSVDISVAMGDANDEVKSICDYTSIDAGKGGVAHALKHFGLI